MIVVGMMVNGISRFDFPLDDRRPYVLVSKTQEIKKLKLEIESSGLKWSGVESVNVHESIKTASADCDQYIKNYVETLHNLAENGLRTVCYNFMPVLE